MSMIDLLSCGWGNHRVSASGIGYASVMCGLRGVGPPDSASGHGGANSRSDACRAGIAASTSALPRQATGVRIRCRRRVSDGSRLRDQIGGTSG
jgi:hypothetical protein